MQFSLLLVYIRIITKYDCSNNQRLCNLNTLHQKWCSVFSKAHFSDGILSSQRSETINTSLERRLHSTADLCDFYNIFCEVLFE